MEIANLPNNTPAEALDISPEALEVANCYLQNPNVNQVCEELGMSRDIIVSMLAKREVKAYIDSVFMNMGFNNKFQMRELMDSILKKKLQELDEADISTSKDILEVMTLSHKMSMEHMAHELAMEKVRASAGVKTQVNIQQNNAGGSRYASLIEQLMAPNVVDL